MTTHSPTHFVFVDFENVQLIDLNLVKGKPVHVALLIGKNQVKLDFELADQIHKQAPQIELIKIGASGHNALDMTLAYYLGRAVERAPQAHFFIVSKDKDFNPMIAHVSDHGIKVVRCESFAALSFLPKSKKLALTKAPSGAKTTHTPKLVVASTSNPTVDRLEKLIGRLKNNPMQRPKKKSSLLAHINTAYGGKLDETEQNQKLEMLIDRGIFFIGDKDRVTYT